MICFTDTTERIALLRRNASICVSFLDYKLRNLCDEQGGSHAANITPAQPIARVLLSRKIFIVSSLCFSLPAET